jgi:hypothetical protein
VRLHRLPCAAPCWHSKVGQGNGVPLFVVGLAFSTAGTQGARMRSLGGPFAPRIRGSTQTSGRGALMIVQSRHWLDYDPVALVVLVVGMSAVALLGLSI